MMVGKPCNNYIDSKAGGGKRGMEDRTRLGSGQIRARRGMRGDANTLRRSTHCMRGELHDDEQA